MATNTPVPEQETIFVRGSEEHKEYLKHQFGTIKTWVNGFETRIAVAGRAMLLIYVIYITVKAGAGAALPQNIPWLNAGLLILDVFMLALQVLGLEGSVPGLIHLADELESKGKGKEAESVRRAAGTAQFLIAATAIDVVLQYSPHAFTVSGTRLDMSGLAFGYDKLLFIVRLIVIGQYLKAMARLEQKGPKVISQHEAAKKTEAQEQKHIRMDNAAILATVNQAQKTFQEEQDRKFTSHLQHELAALNAEVMAALEEIKQTPMAPDQVDSESILRAIMPHVRATFQSQSRAIVEEVQSHFMSQVRAMITESQSHFSELAQRRQGQPTLRILPGSKVDSEPVGGKANGSPEERLQAAYDLLSVNGLRVSGRALAKEAHVNRGTANEWLERVKGQKSEPDDESTGEHEAIAQSR